MNYSTHLLRHLRNNIGQNIYNLRAKQKLSLKKLSRLSDVPASNLDHYEIGKSEIKLDELLKLSCAFRVKIGDLFE